MDLDRQELVENAEAFISERVDEAEYLSEAINDPDIVATYGHDAIGWTGVALAAINEAITVTRSFVEFASDENVPLEDVEWQGENLNRELSVLYDEYEWARGLASMAAESYTGESF